ncbi:MAG: hypothetical protein RLY78_2013 [Pseudomonadota bacterium]|jgi:putrescine transport system permease protein|uniref:ABC transporter permease subunit n=1 Tax=Pseudaquabacterium rugosum TaxID=2984194 RepID=A0ABU9BB85_9BURK
MSAPALPSPSRPGAAAPRPTGLAAVRARLGALARGRSLVIGIPYAWLLLFFAAPFLIILTYSLAEMGTVRPEPLLKVEDEVLTLTLRLQNYLTLLTDDLYFDAYLSSLKYAATATLICLLIGYPMAYFMARAKAAVQPALLMAVMLPFWTSFLLRVYAWKGLLDEGGLIDRALDAAGLGAAMAALGWIETPGTYLYTPFSMVLGMVYTYLPFMVLPLYSTLAKMDLRLLEAAADLGANRFTAFWLVTVPLSRAGILAGSMLVFIPCIGEFVIPELLGGPDSLMIGRVLWSEFFSNNDWTMASTVAVVLILLIVVPLALHSRAQAAQAAHGGRR